MRNRCSHRCRNPTSDSGAVLECGFGSPPSGPGPEPPGRTKPCRAPICERPRPGTLPPALPSPVSPFQPPQDCSVPCANPLSGPLQAPAFRGLRSPDTAHHGITVRPKGGWRRGVGVVEVAENLSIDGPKSAIARLLGIIVNLSASTAPPSPSLITFPDYVRRIEQPSLGSLAIAQLTAHGMPQSGRPTTPGGWRWGIGEGLEGA
jgi:hypothetical protein